VFHFYVNEEKNSDITYQEVHFHLVHSSLLLQKQRNKDRRKRMNERKKERKKGRRKGWKKVKKKEDKK